MSETPGKNAQIGLGEEGEWLEYSKAPREVEISEEDLPVPKDLPKTEDADSSSFADYDESRDYSTKKAPNAYIIAKFSNYDKEMTVQAGRTMDRSGVKGMVNTAGPSTVSTGKSQELDKAKQIGF